MFRPEPIELIKITYIFRLSLP